MPYRLLKWVTPNQLTLARILSAPILMGLVYLDAPATNWVALLLFMLAGLTDYVDGNLARHRGEVTQLGRMLDPIADKILVTAALVMLVARGHAGAVPTILILMREFAVSGLRQVAVADGVHIYAFRGAKWKAGLQMVATGMLLVNHDPFGLPMAAAGQVMLWAAALLTLWTGYDYFRAYFRQVGSGPLYPSPAGVPVNAAEGDGNEDV
jgi:CDP-diacylglycerol---glycerol-3-phosphate 3-phosphatidyltransferase